MAFGARDASRKSSKVVNALRDGMTPDDAPTRGWAGALISWTRVHPRALLALALALGLLARVALVIRTNAVIDGDEAMVGIQAERILQGHFPTYFYGQSYMGSLEAYLTAPVIALFGPTSWALRVVPIALSIALVYLTWRLALALLPAHSRTTPLLAGLAALMAAAPPVYDAVTELRAWGGQIEGYVITLALLLCAVELADRLRAGAGAAELARRWAILGFFAGLGFWVNPLISYALVACALWLAAPLLARVAPGLWGRRRGIAPAGEAPARFDGRAALAVVATLVGVAIGGLPAWLYAARHSAANITVYLSQPAVTAANTPLAAGGRLRLGLAITDAYLTCGAPRVLDGALPGESAQWAALRLALLVLPVAGLLTSVWLALRPHPATAPRMGLPLTYVAAVTAIFCLGTSGWPILKGCDLDLAGRYIVPLALIAPFLLIALFSLPHLWAALLGGRGGALLTQRRMALLWQVTLVALLIGGVAQGATYLLTTPQRTFQSPYYPRGMTDTHQLLTYLEAHQIQAAWCNHWIGNIVTYETDGQTVCADYYDQVYHNGIQRPPGTIAQVSAAPTPSFILKVVESKPILARELDAQGIPYTIATLPQSGVTVITPARRVDPATVIAGLAEDYPHAASGQ